MQENRFLQIKSVMNKCIIFLISIRKPVMFIKTYMKKKIVWVSEHEF